MSDRERLLSRIRRLMALGSRNSNPHEAARALGLAQKLMLRHNIAPDDLSLKDIRESVCHHPGTDAQTIPAWLNALATVVCMATGCRCWFGWHVHTGLKGTRRIRRTLHFYGLHERPEVAAYVFTVLARQLRASTKAHMTKKGRPGRVRLQTRRNRADQFREGWVTGVWQVLKDFSPTPDEGQLLQRWLTQRLKNDALNAVTVREARTCRGDREARLAGWRAGKDARLHRGLSGAFSPDLLTNGGETRD